jgi:hypothetical protein
MTPSDYCELNRKFIPLANGEKDQAIASYESDFSSRLWLSKDWNKLHEHKNPVVILGEPGSGRSYEFKAQQDQLEKSGQIAFYLELHRLVDARIESILEGTEAGNSYESWLSGQSKATFFLDAVDEAKLDKTLDFEKALKNFRRSLGNRLCDAKIFISSRISAWRPEADKLLVETCLAHAPIRAKAQRSKNLSSRSNDQKVSTLRSTSSPTLIDVYAICPLSKESIISLCISSDLESPDSFLEALDRSYAWEFARRPLDVSFLIRNWKHSGEIGDLTEILESTVRELLKERSDKDDHKRAYPLSAEEARSGAESMAAASVFCRILDFTSDDAFKHSRRALTPLDCLPQDWQHNKCKALIDRPLFDSAIYGTFRFHHRRIAEYLAACWLKRRMENECPTPVLLNLLFNNTEGRRILKPSLGSVATWLVCLSSDSWAVDLRNNLLQSNPEVFLRYGDPTKLSASVKRRIFEAFAERFGDREYLNFDTSRYALSRLVDDSTGDSIAELIRDPNIGSGPRLELLKCATESRCYACVSAALEIIINDTQDRRLIVSEAIELIGVAGTPQDLQQLKNHALQNKEFRQTHLGWLVRYLFPHNVSVAELKGWLLEAPNIGRLSTQRYFVKSAFEKSPKGWCPIEMLAMLCELNEASLHCKSTGRDPNYTGAWTKGLMVPLIRNALIRDYLTEQEAYIVGTACAILSLSSSWREEVDLDRKSFDLSTLVTGHPQVKRVMFWLAVDSERSEDRDPKPEFSGNWALSHTLNFELSAEDQDWLLEDLSLRQSTFDKEVAAWLLVNRWQSNGSKWREGRALLERIKKSGLNHVVFRKSMLRTVAHWPPGWYYRLKRKGVFSKWYWTINRGRLRRRLRSARNLWMLHVHIKKIRNGEYCSWLVDLCGETDEDMLWIVKDWSKLENKYGRRITKATQEGCVRVWECYTPEIKSDSGTPNGVIAGLSGLQYLYQNGKLNLQNLSSQDARKATLYGVNEMNGHAAWIGDLAESHPVEVRAVLAECIKIEWEHVEDNNFWCRHLELLADKETSYSCLILEDALHLLRNHQPGNANALTATFKLLTTHGRYPAVLFADRAYQQLTQTAPEVELYRHWLAILIQVDAARAMDHLEATLDSYDKEPDPKSNIVVRLCVMLQGRRDSFPMVQGPDYLNLNRIERFIKLVFRYVNPKDDIPRPSGEAFTPVARDDAQSFRGSLLSTLADMTAPEAEGILLSLASDPAFKQEQDWLRNLADKSVGERADAGTLTPADLRAFIEKNEYPPKTTRNLFDLTMRRLQSIKHDVEEADHSLRKAVREEDREVDFRRFVARKLNQRKNGLYICTEESVIRDEERLDIRVENPECEGHVVIEAKIANLNRSLNSLISDLESQLCDRYLNDEKARFGIFLIACTADKTWINPAGGQNLSFYDVITRLKVRAEEIRASSSGIEGLEVIGMDFRS